jgi:hypothetical protein
MIFHKKNLTFFKFKLIKKSFPKTLINNAFQKMFFQPFVFKFEFRIVKKAFYFFGEQGIFTPQICILITRAYF